MIVATALRASPSVAPHAEQVLGASNVAGVQECPVAGASSALHTVHVCAVVHVAAEPGVCPRAGITVVLTVAPQSSHVTVVEPSTVQVASSVVVVV